VSVLLSGFINFVKIDEVISLFAVKVVTSIFNLDSDKNFRIYTYKASSSLSSS
jgi:hypothetical protein